MIDAATVALLNRLREVVLRRGVGLPGEATTEDLDAAIEAIEARDDKTKIDRLEERVSDLEDERDAALNERDDATNKLHVANDTIRRLRREIEAPERAAAGFPA